MAKTKVLVDMDGVLVDLFPRWIHNYSLMSGQVLFPEDLTAYELGEIIEDQEVLYNELDFESVPPKLGSKAFGDLLARSDLDVYVVTYVHASNKTGHREKLEWLAHYFPNLDPDRVIFTRHKELVRGDVLVEDNPGNIERWLAANPEGRVGLVLAPYNQGWLPPHGMYSEIVAGQRFDAVVEDLLPTPKQEAA